MSFVLNLQVQDVRQEAEGPEEMSLSFLSPFTCFSTTSVAIC
ncbi:hypothetical protein [Streptosporangium sp. NPDC023615]